MTNLLPKHLVFITILGLLAVPTFAQTPAAIDSADSTNESLLSDDDLSVDLEAEALPTTERLRYWWERVSANITQSFTRNAERKAELYEEQLHRLDRKAEACAAIGDEECLAKIEQHRTALTERAERFITRREELKGKLLERFKNWRENREARREELQAKLKQNKDNMKEKREDFREMREESRQHRRQMRQNNRENQSNIYPDAKKQRIELHGDQKQEIRQEFRDQKQTNRDTVFEKNTDNVKVKVRNKSDVNSTSNVTSEIRVNTSTE